MIPSASEKKLMRAATARVYRATVFQDVRRRDGRLELWVFGRLEDPETEEPKGPPLFVGQLVTEAVLAPKPGGLVRIPESRSQGRWWWDEDLVRLDEAQLAEARRWFEQHREVRT